MTTASTRATPTAKKTSTVATAISASGRTKDMLLGVLELTRLLINQNNSQKSQKAKRKRN